MDRFDDFLKSKLEQGSPAFQEKYWKEMETRLETKGRKRRGGLLIWFGLGALVIGGALAGLLLKDYSSDSIDQKIPPTIEQQKSDGENHLHAQSLEEKLRQEFILNRDQGETDQSIAGTQEADKRDGVLQPTYDSTVDSKVSSTKYQSQKSLDNAEQGNADKVLANAGSVDKTEKDNIGVNLPEPISTEQRKTEELKDIAKSEVVGLEVETSRDIVPLAAIQTSLSDIDYAFSREIGPHTGVTPKLPKQSRGFIAVAGKAFSYVPAGSGTLSHTPGYGAGLEVAFPLNQKLALSVGGGIHVQSGGLSFQKESRQVQLGFAANQEMYHMSLTELYQAYADLSFDYYYRHHVFTLGGSAHYGYAGRGVIQKATLDGLNGFQSMTETEDWINLDGIQRWQPEIFFAYGRRFLPTGLKVQLGLHLQHQSLLQGSSTLNANYGYQGNKLKLYPRLAVEFDILKMKMK